MYPNVKAKATARAYHEIKRTEFSFPANMSTSKDEWYEHEYDDEGNETPTGNTPSYANITGWYDYSNMAKFIYPRVVALRQLSSSVPGVLVGRFHRKGMSEAEAVELARCEWERITHSICYAMKYLSEWEYETAMRDKYGDEVAEEYKRKGLRNLGRFFQELWD